MPKTVNEAALEYAIAENDRRSYAPGHSGETKDAFLAGAEWMRKQFKVWGTDDCIEPDCEGDGRSTMYVTLEGRCIGCQHKRERTSHDSQEVKDGRP